MYVHNHPGLYMQQHDQIPVFCTLKKKKVNYLVKLLIEVLLYQPRGHFIAAAGFLTAKNKEKLLAIACSYMVVQDLGSTKWCSLINTKSTSFPWSCCCTAKGWQQQHNPLSQQFPCIWRHHHRQLGPAAALCSHSFSLCLCVSYQCHPSNFSRTINGF